MFRLTCKFPLRDKFTVSEVDTFNEALRLVSELQQFMFEFELSLNHRGQPPEWFQRGYKRDAIRGNVFNISAPREKVFSTQYNMRAVFVIEEVIEPDDPLESKLWTS